LLKDKRNLEVGKTADFLMCGSLIRKGDFEICRSILAVKETLVLYTEAMSRTLALYTDADFTHRCSIY
jgi:hypothetical protein